MTDAPKVNGNALFKLVQEKTHLYVLSVLSLCLTTFFAFLIPYVIKKTIDTTLGGETLPTTDNVNSLWDLLLPLHLNDDVMAELIFSSGLVCSLGALVCCFNFLKDYFAAKACESTLERIRNCLFFHLHHLPASYMSQVESGDVLQRCTADLLTLKEFFLSQVMHTGRTIILLLVVVPLMFYMDWMLSVLTLAFTPLIFFTAWYFYRRVKRQQKSCKEAESLMTRRVQENFSGVRVVKAFTRQDYEIQRFERANESVAKNFYKLKQLSMAYKSTLDVLSHLQSLLLLVGGAYLVLQGLVSIGTYFAFMLYLSMINGPVKELGRDIGEFGKATVAVNRLQEILSQPLESHQDTPLCIPPPFSGNILFSNVHFAYQQGSPVLKGVSFHIGSGQTVAIVGPTGAGKSTLFQLLLRFYDYQSGSITIDGMELKSLDRQAIRQQIGILLQEPFLFSRTMRENLKFGRPLTSDERMMESTREADIYETIESFQQQYDTLIGEKGVTLSGGQCQRVSLARTLLLRQPILMLDDTLSAVDANTEQNIIRSLHQKQGQQTLLIITHRLSVCQHADKILVLDKGEIIQEGHHSILKDEEGLYQELWQIQTQERSESLVFDDENMIS